MKNREKNLIAKLKKMVEHPGKLLAEYLLKNGYTQKSFSIKLGKKVSEINELIKGKRNITIAWDVLLSKNLGTPPKFWILKQIDYDYEGYSFDFRGAEIMDDKKTIKGNKNDVLKESIQGKINMGEFRKEEDQKDFLRENIFEKTIPDIENITEMPQKSNMDMKEILKEDPITQENNSSLKQVFESF